jgi:peptidoglycan/xylan/chitin deacetylase (PgdA/CDA1 family)
LSPGAQAPPTARAGVALTFDDGPHPVFTPAVLAALAAHGARATFFLVGRRAERFPEVARAVRDAGHEIGNHTYGHRHAWTLGPAATRREVAQGAEALRRVLGQRPAWFRPPWGRRNPWTDAAVRAAGERLALWTLDGGDWLPGMTADRLVRRVGGRVAPGDVVDLHDDRAVAAAALPRILAEMDRRGLRCVRLGDLAGRAGPAAGAAGATERGAAPPGPPPRGGAASRGGASR